jgi:OPA family glycerol-3-phosphate transporter-like MFS transporter
LNSRAFWLVCGMSAGMTFLRETLTFWTPTYLTEVAGMTAGGAARASQVVPLAGAAAVLGAGWAADRLGGRFGRVAVGCLVGLAGVLGLVSILDLTHKPVLAVGLLAAAGALLLAPYSFCAGALSARLGGRRSGSTTAGFVDAAGYFPAVLSGSVVARVVEVHGWPAAFAGLAVVALGTVALAAAFGRTEAPLQADSTPR